MSSVLTLTEDYAYNQYRVFNLQSTVIDASDAHWIVSNMGANVNRYPVFIDGGADVTLQGGVISGEVPLDMERVDAYINSAAIFVRGIDDVVIRDWTISQAWDGIRVHNLDNFVIDRVWISDIRDDAVENDMGLSGTISNSLFDGVFVGVSLADHNTPDRTGEVVTIKNTLIRMESYLNRGEITHETPFKVTSNSPGMSIHDSIIAIEDVGHLGYARLAQAWEDIVDASGNYYLNLSDHPLPKSYPMPPAGFTVLQGAEARAFWDNASEKWIADFKGETIPPDADADPDPDAGDAGSTDAGSEPEAAFDLAVSFASNRGGAIDLDGSSLEGDVFVFTEGTQDARQVKFFLDDPDAKGAPIQTENIHMHDFRGGSATKANAWDTTKLAEGEHSITAQIVSPDGTVTTITERFVIDNEPDPLEFVAPFSMAGASRGLGDVTLYGFGVDGSAKAIGVSNGKLGVAGVGSASDIDYRRDAAEKSEKIGMDFGEAVEAINVKLAGLGQRGAAKEAGLLTTYAADGSTLEEYLLSGRTSFDIETGAPVRYATLEAVAWVTNGTAPSSEPDFSLLSIDVDYIL